MNPKYVTTTAYYLSFILLGLVVAAEGPTLLQLAENTASTLTRISLFFFYGSLGYMLGSLFSGQLFDRLPPHKLLAGVLLLFGIGTALLPVITTWWLLMAASLVAGFSRGALDVGCNALILWTHEEKANPFMNALHAAFGVGAFLAPLIVEVLTKSTGGIQWVYWSFALASLPLAVWIYFMPAPRPRATPHKEHARISLLPVIVLALCFAFYVCMEAGYGNFIKTYIVTLQISDETGANLLNSAYWGFFTLGRLLGIWIATRLHPTRILILDLMGALFSLGLILLLPNSFTALWIGTALFGISIASIFATFLTLADERLHVTGAMAGWFLVGGSFGGMFAPWAIGNALEKSGPLAMMVILFIATLATFAGLAMFLRVTRKAQT